MNFNSKNFLYRESIIQSTLFKVTVSIFSFLIIIMFLYGKNYWEKQELKLNYNLLKITSNIESKIQSRISDIEEIKNDVNITQNQKIKMMSDIIQQIINNNNKDNNYTINYYDLAIKNGIKSNLEFDKFSSTKGSGIEFNKLLITNNITSINIPVYNDGQLVGFIRSYTEKDNYVYNSFYSFSGIIILTLSLSILIIFLIRKHFNQIELYLNRFCKIIIDNDSDQDQVLIKLPELKPILSKITFFTDSLKRTNLELKSSKLETNKIMEAISDGFYALDRNWQFTFVNNKISRVISADNTELIGRNIWEVFPQAMGSLTYDKMHEAMSQNESVHWEAGSFTIPDQNHEYHAYPYKEGLTVFFRDITELKQQQQELFRLERLNLIGQLAAGISHEIRNPLTTVKGFLQLFGLKSRYAQDKDHLDLMISEIDRANEIITDFLSLAKVSLDDIKLQNINETINKLFPMLQADAFNSNKEVVVDLNLIPDIMMNENEIKQLILNLVRNGLEVTPEQGSVIISTYLKEDKVVLAIKDQGSGIPQEIQEKMGTPFFTTKESGTGLGLAISIGIAQRHEAAFEFETGNNGTIFCTIFPTLEDINIPA
ncbi:MAG TPA: ATP-binding protein [Desulfosporosinus sp.]